MHAIARSTGFQFQSRSQSIYIMHLSQTIVYGWLLMNYDNAYFWGVYI